MVVCRTAELSTLPSALPSYFLLLVQEEVTKEKDTRSPRGDGEAVAVPCVARNPSAGANSAIHGLKQTRLSPPASCATGRCHGTQEQRSLMLRRISCPSVAVRRRRSGRV